MHEGNGMIDGVRHGSPLWFGSGRGWLLGADLAVLLIVVWGSDILRHRRLVAPWLTAVHGPREKGFDAFLL